MKFSFSGRHMEIGDALTKRAKEAFSSLAVKYEITFIEAGVVMKKEGYLFHCDISVKTSSGEAHHASGDADEPYACFDKGLQKIDQQVRKKKKTCRCSCKSSAHNSAM
ncbi:MAG: ribosome-associated translation inhibitor RaiA [Holosporaceae bacterium]|jgi:ribosomal subunit interface protein|nr:ribosome-associated translation inhibitor RaiA [Holosporaceae bacterium]